MPGLRRLTIRDLLAQGRISSNALEYVREEVFTNNADVVARKRLSQNRISPSANRPRT
jgi:hypothetical protein